MKRVFFALSLGLLLISCNNKKEEAQPVETITKSENTLSEKPAELPEGVVKNVILVHGAFADGSGWKGVYENLTQKGYNVTIVQLPETSLEEDVKATQRLIDIQDGEVVLVGHSYGGLVITDAGTDDKVKALVYVAAHMPDVGEKIAEMKARYHHEKGSVIKLDGGYVMIDPKTFHEEFAADLPKETTDFMAKSQVPIHIEKALGGMVKNASWKTKPSWYVVATDDIKVSPELQRDLAKRANSKVTEVKGSHAVFASQPEKVAEVIEDATFVNNEER